jgi:hypothetical protein
MKIKMAKTPSTLRVPEGALDVQTSHNRSVYAHRRSGAGSEKPQSAYGLCAVFLRHILARRNATHCFMGGPKRHIQPERYAKFFTRKFIVTPRHPWRGK